MLNSQRIYKSWPLISQDKQFNWRTFPNLLCSTPPQSLLMPLKLSEKAWIHTTWHLLYEVLKQTYKFDETCQGSVPQSIYAFAISNSYEETIRTAVSMGGDADTMACIAGAIAEVYYGLPKEIEEQMYKFLSPDILAVVEEFKKYRQY